MCFTYKYWDVFWVHGNLDFFESDGLDNACGMNNPCFITVNVLLKVSSSFD